MGSIAGAIIISVLILATYSKLELNMAENRVDPTKIINFSTSNKKVIPSFHE